jgi:activating signal cointegrator complex subunit 3
MYAAREPPRLSAAIDSRLHSAKSLHFATLEDQLVSRRLALRDSLARSLSTGAHGLLPGSLPLARSTSATWAPAKAVIGHLDWPSFAGPFTSSGDGHVRIVKAVYQRFIAQVAMLIGDPAPDAVQAAAFEIYLELNNSHSTVESSASAMCRLLGTSVPLEAFANLKASVSQLSTWRQKHNVLPEIARARSPAGIAADFRPLFFHASYTSMTQDVFCIQGAPIVAVLTPLQNVAHDTATAGAVNTSMVAEKSAPPKAARVLKSTTTVVIDGVWMLAQCTQFLRQFPNEAFKPETLATALLELFQRGRERSADSDARLQSGLFEILGDTGFEFMQLLLEHRTAILLLSPLDIRKVAATVAAQTLGLAPAHHKPQPALGPGVVVSSASDIRAAKDLQKLSRKLARQQRNIAALHERIAEEEETHGLNSSHLDILRDGEATSGRNSASRGAAKRGTLSVDDAIAAVGAGYGGVHKTLLPEGSVETAHEGYKEVLVPPAKLHHGSVPSPLVSVADLHPLAQQTFKGIQKLNRLQSELFDAAYNSNENLLVCAPTGAGKTNVAMLTICHQVLQHLTSDMRIHTDDFKVIYVAPMKALAQEIVAKFSQRLEPIGLRVREFTGDMQLTKREISETQVIVTTPEKWDVITRKAGDGSLVSLVKLLVIDEVHLLADERGAVIESIVARTLRLVESSQTAIRIVGLSATLPNYQDVALFLRVNPSRGLFYFNDAYRPVPLQQRFIGVTDLNPLRRVNMMNKIAFDRSIAAIRRAKQVMVFVHSRKDTAKTAQAFAELARADDSLRLLSPFSEEAAEHLDVAGSHPRMPTAIQGEGRMSLSAKEWINMQKEVAKSRNKELQDLFKLGFGIHHAGMLRSDRALTERMFAAGVIKILVCTATLAWGVNLPAHTVIIKGTQLYNAESGGFTDLGMLDVLQIFWTSWSTPV